MSTGDQVCVHEETVRYMYRIRDFSVVRNYFLQSQVPVGETSPNTEEVIFPPTQSPVKAGPTKVGWGTSDPSKEASAAGNPLWCDTGEKGGLES